MRVRAALLAAALTGCTDSAGDTGTSELWMDRDEYNDRVLEVDCWLRTLTTEGAEYEQCLEERAWIGNDERVEYCYSGTLAAEVFELFEAAVTTVPRADWRDPMAWNHMGEGCLD